MTIKTRASDKKIYLLASLCALLISSSTCLAGIYKWVDDAGNVHYGQQRPSNTPAKRMRVQQSAPENTSTYNRPGSKSKKTSDNKAAAEQDQDNKIAAEKKPESKAEKKRRLAACAHARRNIARMESVGRIRSVDKDGNTTYLSQKQKESRLKRNRDILSKACK